MIDDLKSIFSKGNETLAGWFLRSLESPAPVDNLTMAEVDLLRTRLMAYGFRPTSCFVQPDVGGAPVTEKRIFIEELKEAGAPRDRRMAWFIAFDESADEIGNRSSISPAHGAGALAMQLAGGGVGELYRTFALINPPSFPGANVDQKFLVFLTGNPRFKISLSLG